MFFFMRKKEKKSLVEAQGHRCFWIHNGPVVCNLRELEHAIRNDIDAKTFAYHVTADQNDFANWIKDVLGDSECADALRHVKTRRSAGTTLKKALKEYN